MHYTWLRGYTRNDIYVYITLPCGILNNLTTAVKLSYKFNYAYRMFGYRCQEI